MLPFHYSYYYEKSLQNNSYFGYDNNTRIVISIYQESKGK